MKTRVIGPSDWAQCLPVLRAGEVVAIPTDTVYGVAALPLDAGAIDRLYEAKDRPAEKAIPILVSDLAAAQRIATLDGEMLKLCARFWPGPLTVVAPALSTFLSAAVASDGTVALRMPAFELTLEIIVACDGALAVTSANLSGLPPARSADEVLQQLDGRIALLVDGGTAPGGVASTVVRMTDGELEILREGALSRGSLESALRTDAAG